MPPSELDDLARILIDDGHAVADDFLDAAATAELAGCAAARHERGEFRPARIGAAQLRPDIRGDSICWLGEPLWPAERAVLERIENLRLALNRAAFLGLFDFEAHYARYPPGAGYAPHVDQPHGAAQRRVSLVLYLNHEWQPAAGGELCLHGADGMDQRIEPRGGRLVAFMTAGREHAVLPATRIRWSLTGWLRSR